MCDNDYEILIDKSKSGRERPWKTHKTNSILLSDSYTRISNKIKNANKWLDRAEKVLECGSTLKFSVCPHGHERKLKWARFCRIRLCPMCSWRRSLVNAHNLKKIAHLSALQKPLRWLFLTLTIKNPTGDELQKAITHMMQSWNRFAGYKRFKSVIVGWYRVLEITRNPFDGSYHPHFHVLLAVEPSYFYKTRNDYIEQSEWTDMWRRALKLEPEADNPIVHITIVKQKRNVKKEIEILEEKGIEVNDDGSLVDSQLSGSAVAELAKYATKSSDYLVYNRYMQKQEGDKIIRVPVLKSGIDEKTTDEVVFTLDTALSSRRLIAYGGLLKEVFEEERDKEKLQDTEDDNVDLIHVDEDSTCTCTVCKSNMLEELYSWIPGANNYLKKEKE